MPPPIRALLLKQAALVSVVVLVLGLLLTGFSAGWDAATRQLGWALALAAGIGAFTLWQALAKVRRGFLDGTNPGFDLVAVRREDWPSIDWAGIEERAQRLEALGFRRLGDFTMNRQPAHARGVACLLADPGDERIAEVQQFERLQPTPLMGDEQFTVRVAFGSVLAGRARVMVSDRPVHPGLYLARSADGVYASYPNKALLELLEAHRRLCAFVAERTGKAIDRGFTLARYVLLEREHQAALRRRFERAGTWALLAEFDRFGADPQPTFAAPTGQLRALPARDWAQLEAQAPAGAGAPLASAPQAVPSPADAALRERLASGANWFYWIAGLSLANALASAFGSDWGFAIGLGVTQVVSALAAVMGATEEASPVALALAWGLGFAIIGFFALMGWLAKKPSLAAFVLGMALFALDTLVFLLVADWIGVAFHALALFFLYRGLQAAREMKRAAANPAAAA